MELVHSNRLPGPDVVPAGVYVSPNLEETVLADVRLGPLIKGVKSDDELRLLVNVNIDRGAKVIKTRGTERAGRPDTDPREQVYTEQQIQVIVEEAGKRNVPVMVHAHGDEGAKAAVLAGARSIEHGTFLSDETIWFSSAYLLEDKIVASCSIQYEEDNHCTLFSSKHLRSKCGTTASRF